MDPTVSHREDLIATQECFVDVVQETRVVLNVVVVEHVLAKREILVVSQNIQKKCENDHLFLNEKAQKTIPKLQFRIRFVIPSHEQIKRNHWNRFYRFSIYFDFDHFLGTIHILRQHNFGLFLTHQTHLRC